MAIHGYMKLESKKKAETDFSRLLDQGAVGAAVSFGATGAVCQSRYIYNLH